MDGDMGYEPEGWNTAFLGGQHGPGLGTHEVTSMQERVDARFHPDSVLHLANSFATPNGISLRTYQQANPRANFQRQLASGEAVTNEAP